MSANIDYWELIIKSPTPQFENLFTKEKEYLRKNIKSNSKVLDIGCGDGRNIVSLLDTTQDITGVDNDPKAIEDAKKNLEGHPDIKFLVANALDLPFAEKTFDYSLLLMTLVNLADGKQKALEEMKRVIKDDGKIIVSVYSEKALESRLEIYKQIGLPIKEVTQNSCVVINGKDETYTSEQFSKEEFSQLAIKAGLKIRDSEEVGSLVYIFTLEKA